MTRIGCWTFGPVTIYDGYIALPLQAEVALMMKGLGWKHGWKSNTKTDTFAFFHAHFGGFKKTDKKDAHEYDCLEEISSNPTLMKLWHLIDMLRPNNKLVRCYANGYPYGTDGTIHVDSTNQGSCTWIYYSQHWEPNWGGETVFFLGDEIVASIIPKPGRLIVFPGNVPHIGRGVTRTCPVMRRTLMYKTEVNDGGGPADVGSPDQKVG